MGASSGLGGSGNVAAGMAVGIDPVTGTILNNTDAGKGVMNRVTGAVNGNGGLLGREGGGPEMANIQQGTSVEDVKNAQQGTQNSLQSQQALLQALQGQNGLGQQNTAGSMQQNFANSLGNVNGIGLQRSAAEGLQNTTGMYQNVANGTGPNPAQAMLNQATGANVANQAALMAGQRGAGANVGLMARQAAQQGANTQQQAVGQGATMQANQQLNALSGLTNAQQAVGSLGGNLTNQQAAANQAYANQANQMAGQQIAQTGANTQAQLSNQGQMQNALQGVNNANVGAQSSVNTGNVGLSQSNSKAKQDILGGIMQGGGAAMGMGARGGMVHMADGGDPNMTPMAQPNMSVAPPVGAQSTFGQFMNSAQASNNEAESEKLLEPEEKKDPNFTGSNLQKGTANMTSGFANKTKSMPVAEAAARGGLVKAMVSENEVAVPPSKASSPKEASKYVKEKLSHGGGIKAKTPDEKAVKPGNSYANDKISTELPEGSIVIPRSITQGKNPETAAAKFVAQVLARRNKK